MTTDKGHAGAPPANFVDLLGRLPFLKLSESVSTTSPRSGFFANSCASISNPLLDTAGSCFNSPASASANCNSNKVCLTLISNRLLKSDSCFDKAQHERINLMFSDTTPFTLTLSKGV